MNTKKAPLDNVKVRQAINYAIPIQAIIPSVLYGYGSEMKSPVPNLTPGHDPNITPYKYDIAKAKDLMRQAGVGQAPIPIDLAVRAGWEPHEQAAVSETLHNRRHSRRTIKRHRGAPDRFQFYYTMAIGRMGEPVDPARRSGNATNSTRGRRASTISSRLRFSMIWMPSSTNMMA